MHKRALPAEPRCRHTASAALPAADAGQGRPATVFNSSAPDATTSPQPPTEIHIGSRPLATGEGRYSEIHFGSRPQATGEGGFCEKMPLGSMLVQGLGPICLQMPSVPMMVRGLGPHFRSRPRRPWWRLPRLAAWRLSALSLCHAPWVPGALHGSPAETKQCTSAPEPSPRGLEVLCPIALPRPVGAGRPPREPGRD